MNNLRGHLIPQAADGTSLVVHVGGVTATNIDFAHVLTDKLPLFIVIVVLLAFLLLAAVFRSLLIPLIASVMNLLSVGAALGALNAVFSWGWGSALLHLSGTGPVDAFLPVLIFSVLFGLSMDYEVYLVSRIQEEWRHGARGTAARRNHLNGRLDHPIRAEEGILGLHVHVLPAEDREHSDPEPARRYDHVIPAGA